MRRAKIEVVDTGNIGIYADFVVKVKMNTNVIDKQ